MTQIATKIYNVSEILSEDNANSQVSRLTMIKKNEIVHLDFHKMLFKVEIGNSIEIKLYKDKFDDTGIPKEYNYVVCGYVYKVFENEILISFGGMLCSFVNHELELFENDFVMLACKQISF